MRLIEDNCRMQSSISIKTWKFFCYSENISLDFKWSKSSRFEFNNNNNIVGLRRVDLLQQTFSTCWGTNEASKLSKCLFRLDIKFTYDWVLIFPSLWMLIRCKCIALKLLKRSSKKKIKKLKPLNFHEIK